MSLIEAYELANELLGKGWLCDIRFDFHYRYFTVLVIRRKLDV